MNLIIGLIAIGLVLISFEIIVPGGVLGVLGAIALIAASVVAFDTYGAVGAVVTSVISLCVVGLTLYVEFKFLPKTKMGQKMFLNTAVDGHSTEAQGSEDLIGKEGEAVTKLAPSGKIMVEGMQYEGFSKDGLIDAGERVTVVGRDNFRILVKKA